VKGKKYKRKRTVMVRQHMALATSDWFYCLLVKQNLLI